MPQRKAGTRIDTTAVQGEGSYVILRRLTVGEIKTLRRDKDTDKFDLTEEMVRAHIVEWNWCDEGGNPLPQPGEHPEVFDQVTDEELAFLAEQVSGNAEARKN